MLNNRRKRYRLVLEYDDAELRRNLRILSAEHNVADVRREVLRCIREAHQLCHPEIGQLIEAEMSFTKTAPGGAATRVGVRHQD